MKSTFNSISTTATEAKDAPQLDFEKIQKAIDMIEIKPDPLFRMANQATIDKLVEDIKANALPRPGIFGNTFGLAIINIPGKGLEIGGKMFLRVNNSLKDGETLTIDMEKLRERFNREWGLL